MKKKPNKKSDPDMLDEYDFSNSQPNPYAARYAAGTNLVLLAPDVAAVFPNSDAVNEALRALMKIAQRSAPKSKA
jgi:hypothetical protein